MNVKCFQLQTQTIAINFLFCHNKGNEFQVVISTQAWKAFIKKY